MNAVIVLTRGYNNIKKYDNLLLRNKCLEKFYNKTIDYIIFHEGNISLYHQYYINSKTKIPFIFINVADSFKKTFNIFYPGTEKFDLGYRNMCNFWFCDFWKYVTKYNKILRIDEDCYYKDSDYTLQFDILNNKVASFGKWVYDKSHVTINLNNFTYNFFRNYNIKINLKQPSGPYTNVIGLNLELLRKNKLLYDYINSVKLSKGIYYYRWGDLPLWGEILYYFYSDNKYTIDKTIQYHHGSHKTNIN